MKKFLLSICLMTWMPFLAQIYTTPNTGVTWTLDDIAAQSPSTVSVSGSTYTLSENLTVAANDTVLINSDLTLEVESGILITVFGTFNVDADNVTITAADPNAPYEGLRFEEFSNINIQNATISYGGGLRVLTETFTLNNCTITNNVEGATTGGVISLSRGKPQITNNTITFNQLPAISSGANNTVSAYIFNNYIEGNNQENSNRPQINLGLTMANDTLKIIQNTIKGDRSLNMVGGIAVANFLGGNILAIIDGNTITDNRYGMTIVGNNAFAYVRDNIIENNDTQGQPNLGGSGISLNTTSPPMEIIASGNAFRGNLWGITVIGQASINLGDGIENMGENVFANNGNGGSVYALYNNTPNTILALNNCWDENNLPNTLEIAEDVIVHQNDISTLGEVLFDPVNCSFLGVEEVALGEFRLYPNPSDGNLSFDNQMRFDTLRIFDLMGRLVLTPQIGPGKNHLMLNLNNGVYFAEFSNTSSKLTKKIIIE